MIYKKQETVEKEKIKKKEELSKALRYNLLRRKKKLENKKG